LLMSLLCPYTTLFRSQGMPWMDEVLAGSFHPGMLYENFPETIEVGLYFVLNACLIRSLRKVRQENAQLKRENRQLIERVNEAHRSLHEYIRSEQHTSELQSR